MLIPLIKTVRQLLAYLLVAYALLNTYLGPFLIVLLVFALKNQYCFRVWHAIDVTICSLLHGTHRRTISGWTGQHMHNKKRYYYQAKVIDLLMLLLGDKPNHCLRAYHSEKQQGIVL